MKLHHEIKMWGTVGRIWRRICDQFWGSLKKNFSRKDEGLLRTEKGGKEVAQQFGQRGYRDFRQKEQSQTNEMSLVRRRMRARMDERKRREYSDVMKEVIFVDIAAQNAMA